MTTQNRNALIDNSACSKLSETFSDGGNCIISTQLSREQFLAEEDSKMRSLIELYEDHCVDGQIPTTDAIPPEKIASTRMMSRTHCLRIDHSTNTFRFAVWADGANFDGFLSLQNATFEDLSQYSVMADALKSQLTTILERRGPAFFEIRGVLNDRFYFFTKAILPLRSEQGEVVKCFVPFTDKLPDISPGLREKLCLGDVNQK